MDMATGNLKLPKVSVVLGNHLLNVYNHLYLRYKSVGKVISSSLERRTYLCFLYYFFQISTS